MSCYFTFIFFQFQVTQKFHSSQAYMANICVCVCLWIERGLVASAPPNAKNDSVYTFRISARMFLISCIAAASRHEDNHRPTLMRRRRTVPLLRCACISSRLNVTHRNSLYLSRSDYFLFRYFCQHPGQPTFQITDSVSLKRWYRAAASAFVLPVVWSMRAIRMYWLAVTHMRIRWLIWPILTMCA